MKYSIWILICCLCPGFWSLQAQEAFSETFSEDSRGLFDDEEILNLTLRLDISQLQNDRINPEYQNAWLTGEYVAGIDYKMKVQVKARGNFRRSDETCQFPPLRVRFSKKDNLGPFDGDRKLKLVTHCQDEKYVLREYMVYKTYQLISDLSLRVRLCRITYEDISGKNETETHYAFFIEDVDTFAKSLGMKEIEELEVAKERIERDRLTLVHVFQFMIGNPDHSAERSKNIKLLGNEDQDEPLKPVPYDFDWSEVVDASYTVIEGTEDVGIFKKRRFKPLCRTAEEFGATFQVFRDTREKVKELYENSPLLSAEDKAEAIKYYNEFFKIIKSKGKVKKIFIQSCRTKK